MAQDFNAKDGCYGEHSGALRPGTGIAAWKSPSATAGAGRRRSRRLRGQAYGVVKAVFGNFGDFRRLHPALSKLDIRYMMPSEAVMPIHSGALKYFREAGLVR